MVAKLSTSVECNGPLNVSVSVSGQVVINTSKVKAVIPCAPSRIGGGFKIGGTGNTKVKGAATVKADLEDKLLHGGVKGLLGASGSGSINGGGFGICSDKIVGADAEIFGSAGAISKSTVTGDVGVGKDGKGVLHGKKRMTAAGKCSGGAIASVATNEDAEAYVKAYGKDALDDTKTSKAIGKVKTKKNRKPKISQ